MKLISLNFFVIMCVFYVGTVDTHATMHVWSPENNYMESVLFYFHVDSKDQNQVARLAQQVLTESSHKLLLLSNFVQVHYRPDAGVTRGIFHYKTFKLILNGL